MDTAIVLNALDNAIATQKPDKGLISIQTEDLNIPPMNIEYSSL